MQQKQNRSGKTVGATSRATDVFSAFREVREAKVRLRAAETRLKNLKQEIHAAQKTLATREHVEEHYSSIVAKNTKAREEALSKMQSAIALVDTYTQETKDRKAELEAAKNQNAKVLEPLRDKAERAKYAYERAEIKHKTAEKSLKQAKAADLQLRESGGGAETQAQAKAHLEAAIVSHKSAATLLEAAEIEYAEKSREYERALSAAYAQEETLQQAYLASQKQASEQKQQMTKRNQAADAAQKALDEAEAIKDTPEETKRLRAFLEDNLAAERAQVAQVKQLKAQALEISKKTCATRFGFIALAAFVVVLIILIIWILISLATG